MVSRRSVPGCLIVALVATTAIGAEQVYMRQDKGGSLSFSNVPTQDGYERPAGSEPSPAARPAPSVATLLKALEPPAPAAAHTPGPKDFVRVAGGGARVGGAILALKADGTVYRYGLTIGPVIRRACNEQIPGLTDVKAVAVGDTHAVALMRDGTVRAWGMNNNGELGADGQARTEPAPVPGLAHAKAVAAGGYHTLALLENGTVRAWGWNNFGQLGTGRQQTAPAPVAGLEGVTAIAAGNGHSLALKADGTVWAWGSNQYGQLGTGATEPSATPVQVHGLQDVRAIACGGDFSVALGTDGRVWAWGANKRGQLGGAVTDPRATPAPIENLTHVVAMTAGNAGGVAVRDDGSVWTWGMGSSASP